MASGLLLRPPDGSLSPLPVPEHRPAPQKNPGRLGHPADRPITEASATTSDHWNLQWSHTLLYQFPHTCLTRGSTGPAHPGRPAAFSSLRTVDFSLLRERILLPCREPKRRRPRERQRNSRAATGLGVSPQMCSAHSERNSVFPARLGRLA